MRRLADCRCVCMCVAGPRAGAPLPRPVLPRERGIMDRMLDYLVGDGPANRYALICIQCQSHNGMALKEEFEYLGETAGVRLRITCPVLLSRQTSAFNPQLVSIPAVLDSV